MSFDVSEGEGGMKLSLAMYTLPNGGFSFDTADEPELVDFATKQFPPGEHFLSLDPPAGIAEEGAKEQLCDGHSGRSIATIESRNSPFRH